MSERPDILKIESLRIGYGNFRKRRILLPPLTASAYRGELVAVVGLNGIGKSTLLRSITGLQPSFGGSVLIDGRDIKEFPRLDLAKQLGYISTEIVRASNMTVHDLVALGRFPHTNWIGKIDETSREKIEDAIFRTGISSLSRRYVAELSDGERQRAMIARVLAQDAGIMVMDEPTAFLDISNKHEILNLMLNLVREGRTIIFSTHDLNTALHQADRIWLILNEGLTEGAPEDLILSGSMSRLFDSSKASFNLQDGSFSFSDEIRGSVGVQGSGIVKTWTEKAVRRAGYCVSSGTSEPYILTPETGSDRWVLVVKSSKMEFRTLYELVRYLGKTGPAVT